MIQISEIPALLEQLEDHIADDLEGQELDFKQWEDNFKEMMKILVRAVVSFANAGEGLVIVGVRERVKGCERAVRAWQDDRRAALRYGASAEKRPRPGAHGSFPCAQPGTDAEAVSCYIRLL